MEKSPQPSSTKISKPKRDELIQEVTGLLERYNRLPVTKMADEQLRALVYARNFLKGGLG